MWKRNSANPCVFAVANHFRWGSVLGGSGSAFDVLVKFVIVNNFCTEICELNQIDE